MPPRGGHDRADGAVEDTGSAPRPSRSPAGAEINWRFGTASSPRRHPGRERPTAGSPCRPATQRPSADRRRPCLMWRAAPNRTGGKALRLLLWQHADATTRRRQAAASNCLIPLSAARFPPGTRTLHLVIPFSRDAPGRSAPYRRSHDNAGEQAEETVTLTLTRQLARDRVAEFHRLAERQRLGHVARRRRRGGRWRGRRRLAGPLPGSGEGIMESSTAPSATRISATP
jgi:hypothetical protein